MALIFLNYRCTSRDLQIAMLETALDGATRDFCLLNTTIR